jgi:phosphate transport system substrate-binding protein
VKVADLNRLVELYLTPNKPCTEGEKDNMNRSPLIVICAFLIALPLAVVCQAQEKKSYKIGGANLFSSVFERFSESFQKTSDTCRPLMIGSTTGRGISEFINGDVALVWASRAMNSKEKEQAAAKGMKVSEKPTGKTALAVVTSANNPVNELSVEQLRKIFAGEIANWKDVGGLDEPIRVTIRAVPETGAGVLFQKVVLKGAPYAPQAQVMGTYRTTLAVVGKSHGIGYIPTASAYYHKMSKEGVKEIKIRFGEGAPANNSPAGLVRDTTFPLSIPLILIWNEKATEPCISNFVDFVDKAIVGGKPASTKGASKS